MGMGRRRPAVLSMHVHTNKLEKTSPHVYTRISPHVYTDESIHVYTLRSFISMHVYTLNKY